MKLTVKNLKGEKFEIEVEESQTVEQVKVVIVSKIPRQTDDTERSLRGLG